jgi:hypothetical protein
MTNAEIEKIARLMGAKIAGELPDVGHGATGATHLARFYQLRMEELRTQDQAKGSTDANVSATETSKKRAGEELATAVAEAENAVEKLNRAMAAAKRFLGLLASEKPAASGSTPVSSGAGR